MNNKEGNTNKVVEEQIALDPTQISRNLQCKKGHKDLKKQKLTPKL